MIRGIIIAALLFVTPWAAAQPLQEGEWEFEIRYEFIGVPQHFPAYRIRQCISQDAPLPAISRPGHECSRERQRRYGDTYTWMVDCSSDWEMVQGMGRIHYQGATARGDVHVQVINPYNPPQPMVFYLRGKQLGECD